LFDSANLYWWKPGVTPWKVGDTYAVGEYVYTEGVFYRAVATTGNPSSGEGIDFDSEATWDRVGEISVWTNGDAYAADSFVQYEQQLYYTVAGGTANDFDISDGISIDGDIGVIWTAVESTWKNGKVYVPHDIVSHNGMLFRADSTGISSGTGVWDDTGVDWVRLDEGYFVGDWSDPVDMAAYSADLADVLALEGSGGAIRYTGSGVIMFVEVAGTTEIGVPFFLASGNLLNWASASKFDVQKKILTGGKYDENSQLLIGQGRGCSSRGFVKEVAVTDNGGTDAVLTLSLEGSDPDNWIDNTDYTTRISILGITADGYATSSRAEACQNAIIEIGKGADASLGTTKGYIDDCLAYSGANNVLAESNAAYNHGVFTCWKRVNSGYVVPSDSGNVSEIENACESIYDEIPPAAINPEKSGYLCAGVYNPAIPDARTPTGTGSDRIGYVGRCWEPATTVAGCSAVACAPANTPGDPRCGTDGLLYDCSGNYNSNKDTCNKAWVLRLVDGSGNPCAVVGAPAQWTDDLNPNTVEECIQEALWDYCGSLSIPEVIDPTDLVFNTTETWGLVGALVDSGIMSMFGTDRPLQVMKGFIKKTTAPQGILHNVAGDLRLGAMAFNNNGANTECAAADPTDAIVEYCPGNNKDGAQLLAAIKSGVEVTDDKGTVTTSDDVTHVDDLTAAINAVEATAWTPLAEAVYNAIGYYGQNDSYRLNPDDFLTEAEGGATDPVQYWCQENNILIITEGASTADIHPDVVDLVTSIMPGLPTPLEDLSVVTADEEECLDVDGSSLLFGSTYLDDVTYFGQEAPAPTLYTTPAATPGKITDDDGIAHNKQNINTYIVTTGTLRDDGTTSECNPLTIMTNAANNGGTSLLQGSNPQQLESNLQAALSDILSRVSAGSAASVISSTRSGAGAVYQAIFWPELMDASGDEISWVGDVHALFLDSYGRLYEDTVADRTLNITEDERILFFFDQSVDPSRTRACDGTLDTPEDTNNNGILDNEDTNCDGVLDLVTEDANGDGILDTEDTNGNCVLDISCTGTVKEIDAVNYIWSVSAPNANGWLSDDTNIDPITQRPVYISNDHKRYIFTWNDVDNDGLVDAAEQVDFSYGSLAAMNGLVSATRGSVMDDFAVADAIEWEKVVRWVRGEDQVGMRSRGYDTSTWRLGDVIHSTPTLVGRPVEAYHFVYRDPSYSLFAKRYNDRRNVVYFGANDGMLHAINAGFYVQNESKFCLTDQRDVDGNCDTADEATKPLLGAELWGYIPYNLQPHLKCLTDTEYDHKYYVDQRPRVFDVQIFKEEPDCSGVDGVFTPGCNHPGGWGTILVGSMRFGGAPVLAADLNGMNEDEDLDGVLDAAEDDGMNDNGDGDLDHDYRKFISAYFILDISNPETEPNLLAEMTMNTQLSGGNPLFTELGYSTVSPSMSVMRDSDGATRWYLILGNGPTTVKGENTEQGKVAILPLAWLTGVDNKTGVINGSWSDSGSGLYEITSLDSFLQKPFRIPNQEPDEPTLNEGGRYLIPAAASGDIESFTSDMVSVDYDIEGHTIPGIGTPYKTDAVYFGTTDGTGFSSGFAGCTGIKCWQGGGRLYRLVTKDYETVDDGDPTNDPDPDIQTVTEPWDWYLAKMIDTQQPISAAPSIGWDNYNFWVYIGTGRFFDKNDKPDDQTQRMFGLLEHTDCDNKQTWPTVNWWVAGTNKAPDSTQAVGDRGLMRVDPILVELGIGSLYCQDGTTNCRMDSQFIPAVITTFADLRSYIAGETDCNQGNNDIGLDGWFREFPDARERNLGQATLLVHRKF